MADAGDEVMLLIRFFDTEEADSTMVHKRVQQFLDRIAYLFIEENVWTVHGHTSFTLEYLKVQRAWTVNGRARSIRGPGAITQEFKSECIAYLKRWVVFASVDTR